MHRATLKLYASKKQPAWYKGCPSPPPPCSLLFPQKQNWLDSGALTVTTVWSPGSRGHAQCFSLLFASLQLERQAHWTRDKGSLLLDPLSVLSLLSLLCTIQPEDGKTSRWDSWMWLRGRRSQYYHLNCNAPTQNSTLEGTGFGPIKIYWNFTIWQLFLRNATGKKGTWWGSSQAYLSPWPYCLCTM